LSNGFTINGRVTVMDRLREIFLYFVAALAMLSLLCAVYQAMNNSLRSAGVLATIFLVSALIVFIPQLEMLKAWGVEARLNKTLDRAEEIIGRLRRLSTVSARVTYLTMAWSNRWGVPPAKEKMAVLDDINKQLEEMQVTPEERKAIARPLVRMVGVDLYNIYIQTLDRYLNFLHSELLRKPNRSTAEQVALDSLTNKQSEWRQRSIGKGPYLNLDTYDFPSELERASPSSWLELKDRGAAEAFKNELVRLFGGCEAKGGLTNEFATFYDRYSKIEGADLKIKELFNVNELK
jgi:hypothetical protein